MSSQIAWDSVPFSSKLFRGPGFSTPVLKFGLICCKPYYCWFGAVWQVEIYTLCCYWQVFVAVASVKVQTKLFACTFTWPSLLNQMTRHDTTPVDSISIPLPRPYPIFTFEHLLLLLLLAGKKRPFFFFVVFVAHNRKNRRKKENACPNVQTWPKV